MSFPYSQELQHLIHLALDEDKLDLTSQAIFSPTQKTKATLLSKEEGIICGLPLIDLILSSLIKPQDYQLSLHTQDGSAVHTKQILAEINAPTITLLRAERIILNFMTHLSGIATLTSQYLKELEGTGVQLLDTRKTLPSLRALEKYAVRCAGATNHRFNLSDMLMLKDNHIDAVGSISQAVQSLRTNYNPCPPIEIECRTLEEVLEAMPLKVERLMLDNMDIATLQEVLPQIPLEQAVEISGQVNLENIRSLALCSPRRPDYISVGRLTHSAKVLDLSLVI